MPAIYPAMGRIMREIGAVGKTQRNTQQNFNFRGIDDVMNELHLLFARNGVVLVPNERSYTVDEKRTDKGSILYFTKLEVDFHFISCEDSSEVMIHCYGEAMDSADKGLNKAKSVALKYALLQAFLIPTVEPKDPDTGTPEETRPTTFDEYVASLDPEKDAELLLAIGIMRKCKTINELVDVWNEFGGLQSSRGFNDCIKHFKLEIMRTE